jgi:hypothetical protein
MVGKPKTNLGMKTGPKDGIALYLSNEFKQLLVL